MLARLARPASDHVYHRRAWNLARRGLRALRSRVDGVRAVLAYEKIEGLRAEAIKATLKELEL